MAEQPRIGVVGATGAVGTVTLELLRARGYENVRVFASARSAGKDLGGWTVEEATPDALSRGDVDIFLFSVGTSASRELVPLAVSGGAVAVDKSSAYRLEPGIPLVVPEVNPGRALEHASIPYLFTTQGSGNGAQLPFNIEQNNNTDEQAKIQADSVAVLRKEIGFFQRVSDELHKTGLRQNAELQAEMDKLLRPQGLSQGTVGERLTALGRSKKFLYPATEAGRRDLLAYLNGRIEAMRARLDHAFGPRPKTEVIIRRVPEEIQDGAPQG